MERCFTNVWKLCLLSWALTLLSMGQLLAQNTSTVTGKVTDETGQALPGVTVLIKSTTNGTTTNAEGTYRLSVSAGNATLVVSYVGYVSQEIQIKEQSVIDIRLAPDNKTLNEVVVVGYATVRSRKKI